MNPRTFCREAGYECAICLTYSFDPIFFERVVLHDLWAGGSSDVAVVADEHQTRQSVQKAAGQLSHLGRRYQLATMRRIGAQHAKLILRVGREGALVWLGSNNLTASAWTGGNRELASAWHVQRQDETGAGALKEILHNLLDLVPHSARRTIDRALDQEWLATAEQVGKSAVIISSLKEPIGAQIARRWNGRSFRKAQILTGSTDENGAMLRWLSEQFGVKEAVVALDPKRSAFQASKLEHLPLNVSIIPLESHPAPHSKLVFLYGTNGNAAVVGSANCSAAAWLIPPGKGGNVESVLLFDECEKAEFESCLAVFADQAAISPADVSGLGASITTEPDSEPVGTTRLLELICSAQLGEVRATVSRPITPSSRVELEIGTYKMPLRSDDGSGTVWIGPMPDFVGGWTQFGRLVLRTASGHVENSDFIWLTEEDELEHTARGRQISGTIGSLSRPTSSSSEQQKLLQELAKVASALFSNHRAFPDPVIGRTASSSNSLNSSAANPVDPDDLVCTIGELGERARPLGTNASLVSGLPLVGVMRVLFPPATVPDDAQITERSREENERRESEEPLLGIDESHIPEEPVEPPPEKFRSRLTTQVERFLEKLADAEFAEKCTATQLVQAVAFPLAVAVTALEGGWISDAVADSWAFRVTDLLLRVSTKRGSGLLTAVRERYKQEGRLPVFEKIVGDGRLWIAVSAALGRAKSSGIERSLALADVYREPLLYCKADPERVQVLLSSIRYQANARNVLVEAKKSARLLKQLEEHLTRNSISLAKAQIGETHLVGDTVWRREVGFGRVEEEVLIEDGARLRVYLRSRSRIALVVATYYTNLRLAAVRESKLGGLLSAIMQSS